MAEKQIFVQPLDEVSTTEKDILGDIRNENGKVYKYVQLDEQSVSTVVTGNALVYIADTGYAANQVTADMSTGDATTPIAAGVVNPAAVADDEYFWMQIQGAASISTTIASGADGNGIQSGTTDRAFTRAAGTGNVRPCGVIVDISALEVVLDCVL